MKTDLDLFIWEKDEVFLGEGDTLKTPKMEDPKISNRICKYIKDNIVEIDGKQHKIARLTILSFTKETKRKTLRKQIELMETKLQKKKEELKLYR